jgi:hypothetical protein
VNLQGVHSQKVGRILYLTHQKLLSIAAEMY